MRILTYKGPMEYLAEPFRNSVSAETYAFYQELFAKSFQVPLTEYYTNQVARTGALRDVIVPILEPERIIINTVNGDMAAAAEKKRLSEYVSPQEVLVEQQRIIENTITPEQANLNLIEAENDQRWKETLLEVAITQEKYPEAIFLQGTAPELIEWEKTAADLGITIPLKAAEITTDGKVSGKVFDLQSQQVKPDSQAQPDLFISVSWLDRVVNYIYKQIHKN